MTIKTKVQGWNAFHPRRKECFYTHNSPRPRCSWGRHHWGGRCAPWTNPSGSPGAAEPVLQAYSPLSWHSLPYCSPCNYTKNRPKIVLESLDKTCADSCPNKNEWQPKTGHHCRLGQTQGLWGHRCHLGSDVRPGLRVGIERTPTSQYFPSPRKGRRVMLVPFRLYSWLVWLLLNYMPRLSHY